MIKIYIRILSIAVAFSLISFTAISQSPGAYYWDGPLRRLITVDSTEAIVNLSQSEVNSFQQAGRQMQITKRDQNLHAVTRNLSKEDKRRLRSRTGYAFTTYENKSQRSFITDEISVKFKNAAHTAHFERKYGIKLSRTTPYGAHIFKSADWSKTLDIANTIYENEKAQVEWSTPNFSFKLEFNSDPRYAEQYYLNNTGQNGGTAGFDINAPEAWAVTTGCAVRVAVIDQGVDAHEEFGARLATGFTVGSTNTHGAPINGLPEGNSKNHGVACAGIIAAGHNGVGIQGIAPNSIIVPVNVSPDPATQNLTDAVTMATAIHWAWHDGNAAILNCSWSSGAPSSDISDAILDARTLGRGGKGSIVVFASGNNSSAQVNFPGSVNGVITVGAINKNGNIWGYSNTGPEMDLVAPSGDVNLNGDVVSTDREDDPNGTILGWDTGKYTTKFGGTSAATPQVSGVAALVLSINPLLTEPEVRTILQNSATDLGSQGFDNTFGFGLLNAKAAVDAAIASLHLSMTGYPLVCSQIKPGQGTTFTLNGLPANATITWTKSSNLTEVSGQGTANYKVKAASASTAGTGWVTATVNACSNIPPITYDTWVGKPYDFVVNGPASMTQGASASFSISLWGGQPSFATQGVTATGFSWTFGLPSTAAGWSCGGCTGQSATITAGPQSTYVTGNVSNSCGIAKRDQPVHVEQTNCPPGGCWEPFFVSPNPTSEELLVAPASTEDAVTSIRLSNSNGDMIYSMESIGKEELRIPVSSYQDGTYFISITRDQKTTKHQIVIKH